MCSHELKAPLYIAHVSDFDGQSGQISFPCAVLNLASWLSFSIHLHSLSDLRHFVIVLNIASRSFKVLSNKMSWQKAL